MIMVQEHRDSADYKGVGHKRGSQLVGSGVASNSNSLKRSMVMQNPSTQTYNYASQIKDAAERQQHIQVQDRPGKSGAKHHGHRKNQPVPIDTFNIVSNRRKSLVKQVNEANASTDAMINNAYANLSSSQ